MTHRVIVMGTGTANSTVNLFDSPIGFGEQAYMLSITFVVTNE